MNQLCVKCSDDVAPARWALGFHLCLVCGEATARAVKHCVVPMHKSNYVPVHNLHDLVGINSKGGIVHNFYEQRSTAKTV